jgi:type II restriction enzyme
MAFTGNIGEWSEIYTLLKVLGDEKLFTGDENIEKVEDLFYPIISILRTEANGKFEYIINKNLVLINTDGKTLLSLPIKEFAQKATKTLAAIRKHIEEKKEKKKRKEKTEATFSIPEIESFMNKIQCSTIKAGSDVTPDITIVIHDQRTNNTPELAFSIKSQLGDPASLFNAGKSTNFKYKVSGLTSAEVASINNIKTKYKIKDRLKKINELNGIMSFVKPCHAVFNNNLILIDSLLPNILSEILFTYYTDTESKLSNLVKTIEVKNPLNFDKTHSHLFYTYKIKKLLTDAALGMKPAKVWTGKYDATGGYLVVKESGDVLCYHLYNRNEFEQYLFANTKFETASTSRHGFATIYTENNEFYMNLNLQIRFIK